MKIKDGFIIREICGEHIIVAEGEENIDFTNIISINETSVFLWNEAKKLKDFTIEDLVNATTKKYSVDENKAKEDITSLVDKWEELGLIKL